MVVGSLLEFLRDANSAGRLIYELAKTAKGTFDMNIRQAGGPVRAKCQHTGRLVWMKLLELPMAEDKGKLTPHGDFLLMPKVQAELKGGTNNCSIELYGFEGCIPELCDPYVLISGKRKDEVDLVAAKVADKLLKHQQKCTWKCKFLH